ncbi:MAG: hypothetical protein ACI9DC_000379 [Gammaproteobacteria bacterium]|jgi:hypothetical protein
MSNSPNVLRHRSIDTVTDGVLLRHLGDWHLIRLTPDLRHFFVAVWVLFMAFPSQERHALTLQKVQKVPGRSSGFIEYAPLWCERRLSQLQELARAPFPIANSP